MHALYQLKQRLPPTKIGKSAIPEQTIHRPPNSPLANDGWSHAFTPANAGSPPCFTRRKRSADILAAYSPANQVTQDRLKRKVFSKLHIHLQ